MDCFGYWAKQVHEIMSQSWAHRWFDASGTRVGLEVRIHSDSEEFLPSYVWRVGMGTARLEWGAICLEHWTPKDMLSTSGAMWALWTRAVAVRTSKVWTKRSVKKGKPLAFLSLPSFPEAQRTHLQISLIWSDLIVLQQTSSQRDV